MTLRAHRAGDGDSGFSPIGNILTKFTGSYNGKSHTISGLTINRSSSDYIRLFGYVSEGTAIDSIGLPGSLIKGDDNVGGLIGRNHGEVSICYLTGNVSNGYDCVGGLIGINVGIVNDCYATGSISGHGVIGGLIGKNEDDTASYCHATGSVNGGDESYNIVGGLIGYNYNDGSVSNCYATGKTTGEMKTKSTFTNAGWDFDSTWDIRVDNTYPALLMVSDNAPFAFADMVNDLTPVMFTEFLANDYDYETLQTSLTFKVIDLALCTVENGIVHFFPTVSYNDTLITYRVGEIRSTKGDTLWGNKAIVILKNVAGTNITTIQASRISVYPNPTSDAFRVTGFKGVATLILSDISGRLALSKVITAGETVSVSTLPLGVYLVIVKSKSLTETHGLIIQR